METKNGALGKVDNGGAHNNRFLNTNHVHGLDISDNGSHEALLSGNGNTDINVVAVNDGITAVGSLNGGIDGRQVAHSKNASSGEGAHETQLDTSLLEDVLLVELSELHYVGHVDLVEGGQGCSSVLRLLETLGNSEAHAVHLDLQKRLAKFGDELACPLAVQQQLTRRSSRLPIEEPLEAEDSDFDSFFSGCRGASGLLEAAAGSFLGSGADSCLGSGFDSDSDFLGSSLGASFLSPDGSPPSSMRTRSWPTVTVSSSATRNSLMVPASVALTATSI
ncbi:hypothetical protein HG531_005051 [Fusarium graminearum]|nr:hypothetical protein HG531_005051 [Fusarium graminearum]